MSQINEIKGDIIELIKKGEFDIMVHGCNCFHAMESGLAAQVKEKLPVAYKKDLDTNWGDINKLGKYTTYFDINGNFRVINAYTQYRPGPHAELEAIKQCLKLISRDYNGRHIALPLIGCGVGGLDWKDVEPLIKIELTPTMKVTVVHYDS